METDLLELETDFDVVYETSEEVCTPIEYHSQYMLSDDSRGEKRRSRRSAESDYHFCVHQGGCLFLQVSSL